MKEPICFHVSAPGVGLPYLSFCSQAERETYGQSLKMLFWASVKAGACSFMYESLELGHKTCQNRIEKANISPTFSFLLLSWKNEHFYQTKPGSHHLNNWPDTKNKCLFPIWNINNESSEKWNSLSDDEDIQKVTIIWKENLVLHSPMFFPQLLMLHPSPLLSCSMSGHFRTT